MADMTWYTIRLDLARSHDFPEGSAAHCYLLRAPLDEHGTVEAAAVRAHPEWATVLRSWPDEVERHGYLIHDSGAWRFSFATGEADDEPLFHLETHPLAAGAYVTVREQDGEELCFKVTRRDEFSLPA
jgi:hypothetical protein